MHLDVRHLEVLVAIDRAGSISGAARLLGTDQPHVSRTLVRIEARLGRPVFERGPHGVRPTAAGRDVLDRAERALTALGRLERRVRPGLPERLRVVVHGFDGLAVMERIETARPGLDIRLSSKPKAEAALQELTTDGADVLVTTRLPHVTWDRPPPVTEIRATTVATTVLLPVTHALAGSSVVDLADLAGEIWLTGDEPHAERSLRAECGRLGGFVPTVPYRTSHIGDVVQLVRGGCIAYGMPFRARPGLVARSYTGATPTAILVQHLSTPAALAFADDVAAAVRAVADVAGGVPAS